MYKLVDFKTKKEVTATNLVFTGDNTPWEVQMDLEKVQSKINRDYFLTAPSYVSKYLPLMPVKDYSSFVSLKEGSTPLIRSRRIGPELGIDLYFKLESQNPTGSFKDRGSAVEITIAKELNAKGIVVASTGNMAASCSCYAATAQIPCFVFVPEDTPTSKLSQAISYGGNIVQVKGTYNDAAQLAEKIAKELNFYLAGDYAFRVEGQKTAAFELMDQLHYQVPDEIFVPIGCGTNVAAYGKGLKEYQQLGFINKQSRIIGVQSEGACSVINAFEKGQSDVEALPRIKTIAGAIAVAYPLDGAKALQVIYDSNGSAVAVSDKEILSAQYRLSREEGLFVESASAAPVAAMLKTLDKESLKGHKIVCVLTGSGLKDPSPILKVAIKPPTIYPSTSEFLNLYNRSFFKGKNFALVEPGEIVFEVAPSKEVVKKTVEKFFNAHFTDEHLEKIARITDKFLKKGKPITFSDFQDIIQDALETVTKTSGIEINVLDFTVNTAKDQKPVAWVSVSIDGEKREAEADGVGPVDAIVNALKITCEGKMTFALSNYKVEIRSQGTDAVVYVELKLVKGDATSLGRGTSPDIIQASIEAFESAYNSV